MKISGEYLPYHVIISYQGRLANSNTHPKAMFDLFSFGCSPKSEFGHLSFYSGSIVFQK